MSKSIVGKAAGRTASDPLAESYRKIKAASTHSGRILHDDVGPLLSAAGLHLQLLRMDHPHTGAVVQEVTGLLDQAIERIRAVSQQLFATPVAQGGLKNALTRLVENTAQRHPGTTVELDYRAIAAVPEEPACAMYEAAAGVLAQAVGSFGAARVKVSVRGSRSFSIRIADSGRSRGRPAALREIQCIARASGITLTHCNQKGYNCLIRYALRRSSGRRS